MHKGSGAQPTAAAHAHQAQVGFAQFQFGDHAGDQARPGGADGMSERDRSAVDVDPFGVGFQFALPRQHHRGERLVDLEQVDVADG